MEALKFNLNQDNRPLREDITFSSIEKSPFKEQYLKSLSEIETYLATLGDEMVDKDIDYTNNIFAFIGNRGSGKTSCMITVGGFLAKTKENRSEFKQDYPKLSDTNFYSLDLIDPSYFDSKHNILSLFLAKLYSAFQKVTKNNNDIKESRKMEFLASLSKAQKHAHLLVDEKQESLITNRVEELECLSAAVDLKDDIRELVENFLDCLGKQYQILLLRIDDIDLNAKEAGVMAELVRKYFIIPNVMVLMALKMDQLETIKSNEFSDSFNLEKDSAHVLEMSVRYLTKLFPHSQRVYMPDIEDLLNRKLILKSGDTICEYPSVQQCVPELIFKKTRYLFYNSSVHASYIVPRNLRDLRQIIKLLWNMEDYTEHIDENFHITQKGKYNQAVFKKYLSEIWINNNLSIDHQKIARHILSIEELMRLNSYVVKEIGREISTRVMVKVCTDEDNSSYNISLGDVLGVIEYKYKSTNDEEEQKFLFFIKTVYSLRLFETYNKITDIKKIPPVVLDKQQTALPTEEEILRKGQYSTIEDFDKIVAGSFLNVQFQPLLPFDLALDNRTIAAKELLNLMRFCANDFETAANSNNVRLLEFFMLAVSHNKSLDSDFRKKYYAVYDAPIDLTDDLIFDLGAFFFNITRLKKCYERFKGYYKMSDGEDLIERIFNSERSLYHDFMDFAERAYHCKYNCPYEGGILNDKKEKICTYYESRWASISTIRNVEILQDFIKFIQTIKVDREKRDSVKLALFFDKCANYEIPTYEWENTKNEKKRRTIHLNFLSKVADVLGDKYLNDTFIQIFGENPIPKKGAPLNNL